MEDNQQQQPTGQPEQPLTQEPNVYEPQPRVPVTPPLPPEEPEHHKKFSKKGLLFSIIVLLLIIAGAAYYLLSQEEEAQPAQETPAQTSQEAVEPSTPEFAIAAIDEEQFVGYLDENNEYKKLQKIEQNEYLSTGRIVDGEVVAYTYTTGESSDTAGSYFESTEATKKKLFDFPENTDLYFSQLKQLSPDGTKLFIEKTDRGSGQTLEYGVIAIQSGEYTKVADGSVAGDSPKAQVAWLDNDNVLLQTQTCRQCDGPRLPVLTKLNLTSGELTPYYSYAGDKTMTYAAFDDVPGGKQLLMYGGDFAAVFEPDVNAENPTNYFVIDLATAKETFVTSVTDDFVNLVGYATDGSSMFVATNSYEKTEATDAMYQSIDDGNFDPSAPVLKRIKLSDGTSTNVSLESSDITAKTFFGSTYETGDRLVYTIRQNQSTETQKTTLSVLPKTGETTEIVRVISFIESNSFPKSALLPVR